MIKFKKWGEKWRVEYKSCNPCIDIQQEGFFQNFSNLDVRLLGRTGSNFKGFCASFPWLYRSIYLFRKVTKSSEKWMLKILDHEVLRGSAVRTSCSKILVS